MKWLQFVMVSVLAALTSVAEVTRETEWQDVPSETKVGEVVDLAEKGADTNAVKDIVRPMIAGASSSATNYTDSAVAAATNGLRSVDGAARPLPRYLHALDFADSYPNEAAAYYRSRGNGKTDGGCSAVRRGGVLERNFDFPLDERAEFVIKMSAGPNRFASVGVAQVGTNLTEAIVTSGKPSRWYKALPGATVDGVNENGVVCEINVVDTPVAGWRTNATDGAVHPLAAVRWVLDNATDAQHGAEYLAANVRFPVGWVQNFHYMVADAEKTYIVENGTATDGDEYREPDEPVAMTNFQLSKFPWGGMGMERFCLLLVGANITNVWYTRAYLRTTNWMSEFEDAAEMEAAKVAWETHEREQLRGKGLWQSVHTSIYDITNRTLRVAVQEQDDWYVFAVPVTGGVKVEADPTVPAWAKQANPPEGMTENALVLTNGAVKTKSGTAVTAGQVGAVSTNGDSTIYNAYDGLKVAYKDLRQQKWFTGLLGTTGISFGYGDDIDDYDAYTSFNAARNGAPYLEWAVGIYGDDPQYYAVDFPAGSGTIALEENVVPTTRKINGQSLTQDITIEGMTANALVFTNNAVKTKSGAKTIDAADVGAYSKYNSLGVDGQGNVIVHEESPYAYEILNFRGPVAFNGDYTPSFPRGLSVGSWDFADGVFSTGSYSLLLPNKSGTLAIDSDLAPIQQTANRALDRANGSVMTNENVVVEWSQWGSSNGAEIGRIANEWGSSYGAVRVWSGWNWRSEMFYDHIDYYHGDRGDGTPYKTTMRFPENSYDVDGRIAMETWYSLSRALADANTNETADCECICTNLCNLISPKILLKSEPHLAYINGELHIIKITEVEE